MMKKTICIALCTLLVVGLSACDEEDFLTENNPNQLSSQTFYQTEAHAEAAVNAVYANLQTIGLYNRRYYFIHDLLSNEAEGMGSLEPDLNQFNTYNLSAGGNATLRENWDALYRGVQRANLVLANVPNVPDEELSQDLRTRFLAEVRFLRAWHYYELVTGWGEVPLLPELATQENIPEGIPKASQEELYELILDDLEFAENNLEVAYTGGDVGRATKGAAAALKGKVRLFRGSTQDNQSDFEAAETELGKFVSSGEYSNASGTYAGEYELVDDYFDNFMEETENNAESILEVQFSATGSANWSEQGTGVFEETFRNQEYGFTAWRNVIPSRMLVEQYEDDDPRLDETVYFPGDTWGDNQTVEVPDDYPSWKKYQLYYRGDEPASNSGNNFRVIRLADVLLSLADAKIELGKNQEAIDLMNEVRNRVNMPTYPDASAPYSVDAGSSKEAMLDALYHEIAVEHAGEQVLHKFQLRRPDYLQAWADGPEYTGGGADADAGFSLPKSLRLPIPQTEIDGNNALTSADQNEGY